MKKRIYASILLLTAFIFTGTVKAQSSAYLLTYFKDDTHSPYFALSRDGYTFGDVNGGKPIMDGAQIAEQKGIRDPHIMRGSDGTFYLVMTDLNVAAERMGYRTTRWERPSEQYGWGNNRAIIMMKSKDLINWSHSIFRLDKAFEETREVGCFWAPQTIYDEEKGKMMVYFTLRFGSGRTDLYYSYADDAFTKLETVPQPLFKCPEGTGCLDADIMKVGDKFHLFYCLKGKIMQAVSDKINRDYVYDPTKCDGEAHGSEAPNLWRRNGTDTYVLMYHPYLKKGEKDTEMGFTETTDFKTFKHLGRFNEGGIMKTTNFNMPNHGAVTPISDAEARALAKHWNFNYDSLPLDK